MPIYHFDSAEIKIIQNGFLVTLHGYAREQVSCFSDLESALKKVKENLEASI